MLTLKFSSVMQILDKNTTCRHETDFLLKVNDVTKTKC